MKIDPNAPVFAAPVMRHAVGDHGEVTPYIDSEGGLSIRAHFAAMAMQGLIALPATDHETPGEIASFSVKCADALIAELNK
jgi:hypothetical protein